ncbi:zinc finger, ZZ type [Dictyocaulus viviparus]|uniref:Zinc finger, ZZ type n=1 Tax=Dictyocaulus viviparus TaxID=29172 RepID=A0A0D8XWN8_DICVI|nr:zinc finger, ZZ type [Dictyocaulus viviparus]
MIVIRVKLNSEGKHHRFSIKGENAKNLYTELMSHLDELKGIKLGFDLAWEDEEGDSILITRPAELEEALDSLKDGILRLHTVRNSMGDVQSEKPSEFRDIFPEKSNVQESIHGNIICDVCDGIITGIRYKCILCIDYDLCQNCVHAQHGMVRIVDPLNTFVPWGARLKYLKSGYKREFQLAMSLVYRLVQVSQMHVLDRYPCGDELIGNSKKEDYYLRMQEKKEQITEQVAKGLQYLSGIGQTVTTVLANLGIDSTYEIRESDMKSGVVDKDRSTTAPDSQSTPTQPPSHGLLKADEKFDNLKKSEEVYRGGMADVKLKGCRCFVSDVGNWICPTCTDAKGSVQGCPSHEHSHSVLNGNGIDDAEDIQIEPRNNPKEHNEDESDDRSSGSDFEALSYDCLHDSDEKEWSSQEANRSNSVVNPTEISVTIGGRNNMAQCLIDMGFSEDEVFRVVEMHGDDFDKCIEEILLKH